MKFIKSDWIGTVMIISIVGIAKFIKNNWLNILMVLTIGGILAAVVYKDKSISKEVQALEKEISNIKDDDIKLNQKVDENYTVVMLSIEESIEATHARIDTVDDSLNIEDKRKVLVDKIRTAILQEKHGPIGVRDLNRIANAVIDYSYEYNLSIAQVLAQMQTESNFNPYAVSSAGAKGLLQIMPHTLKYIQYEMEDGPRNLNAFNIYHNIKAGCFYITQQIEDFGSYEYALMAYNWGPDNLRKYLAGERSSMPVETQNYVPTILNRIEVFKGYGLE